MMASECVNMLNKKTFARSIAIKIDIKKAFNTLNWDFLKDVFNSFGFSLVFLELG